MNNILIIDDDIDDLNGNGGLASDDDNGYMSYYIQELRDQQFSVVVASTVEEALRLINQSSFDIYIVDLMMDPGGEFERNMTSNGLRTGARIVEVILKRDDRARVVVLSNYPDFERAKEDEPYLSSVVLLSKLDTTPSELVSEIKSILKSWNDVEA